MIFISTSSLVDYLDGTTPPELYPHRFEYLFDRFFFSSYLDRCFGSSEVYYPVTRNILLDLQVPYSYPILGNSNLLPLTFPQRIRFTSPQVVHP